MVLITLVSVVSLENLVLHLNVGFRLCLNIQNKA